MGYETKDSGERQSFESGMVRDTQDGKPRYDLIPVGPLKRLAGLYARGAEKYDADNWQKGQPYSRAYASLFRHLIQWRAGENDEDHLAAVAWNAFALMWYEENKPELNDVHSTGGLLEQDNVLLCDVGIDCGRTTTTDSET